MTADDIIAANPHLTFSPIKIGNQNGLSYVDEDGAEMWVIWKGDRHFAASAPWADDVLKAAKQQLRSALAFSKQEKELTP